MIAPRKLEQHKIQTGQWQYHYQYEKVRCAAGRAGRLYVCLCSWAGMAVLLAGPCFQELPAPSTVAVPDPHLCMAAFAQEAFHVRRKEFWPLTKAGSLINKFIPQVGQGTRC